MRYELMQFFEKSSVFLLCELCQLCTVFITFETNPAPNNITVSPVSSCSTGTLCF